MRRPDGVEEPVQREVLAARHERLELRALASRERTLDAGLELRAHGSFRNHDAAAPREAEGELEEPRAALGRDGAHVDQRRHETGAGEVVAELEREAPVVHAPEHVERRRRRRRCARASEAREGARGRTPRAPLETVGTRSLGDDDAPAHQRLEVAAQRLDALAHPGGGRVRTGAFELLLGIQVQEPGEAHDGS